MTTMAQQFDPVDADSLQVATTPDGKIVEVTTGYTTSDPDEVAALTYLAVNGAVDVSGEPDPPPEPEPEPEAAPDAEETQVMAPKSSKGGKG